MNKSYEFLNIDSSSLSLDAIKALIAKAKESEEGVYRLNCHDSFEDGLQQMIICLTNKEGKVHRHKNTDEVISVLEGRMEVVLYDESLNKTKSILLDREENAGILRIKRNTWHKNYPLDDFVVFHEISSGPFKPENMETK